MLATAKYTVSQTIAGFMHQYPSLLKRIGLLVILACILDSVTLKDNTGTVFLRLAGIIIYAIIAVNIHQHLLTKDEEQHSNKNYFIYFYWIIAIAVLMAITALPFILLNAILPMLTILAVVPVFYIYLRISMVLPDRAIGRSTPTNTLWGYSENHVLKLASVLLLIPILLSIPAAIIETVLLPENIISDIFSAVTSNIIMMLEVGLVSISYRELHAANESLDQNENESDGPV